MRNVARILVVLVFAISCFAADRGPSTPAERKKAVEYVRYLEKNPLAPDAKEKRNWVMAFFMDVPDIQIQLCDDASDPLIQQRNQNNANELLSQSMLSSGAFIIQNPKQAKDLLAVQKAGLLGRLKAYEAILKSNPNARWPHLDEMLKLRGTPAFDELVAKRAKACEAGIKYNLKK
ncbi:MAG TPA: hypothetical protein VN577_16045 [Terriglobales bacterium]|nr:hypothetical protein [Terriglobales bacterium]